VVAPVDAAGGAVAAVVDAAVDAPVDEAVVAEDAAVDAAVDEAFVVVDEAFVVVDEAVDAAAVFTLLVVLIPLFVVVCRAWERPGVWIPAEVLSLVELAAPRRTWACEWVVAATESAAIKQIVIVFIIPVFSS